MYPAPSGRNYDSMRNRKIFVIALITGICLWQPSAAQWLKASGKKIVNGQGSEVILRGMGLGGWMLQEPYMMEMSGMAVAQWDIRQKIRNLIGEANTVTFYDAWHTNHCTRKDVDSLAAWGFNSIRLPMHYNLYTLPVEEEPVPGVNTWLEKGFVLTDSLLKWCAANQMYLILDLHAAPGGQGKDYAICDGNPAKASLWDSEANKQKTIALWKKLAERYASEPWIGGYDIINEPNWSFTPGGNQNGCTENSNAPLRQLMIAITNAIRSADSKHIIIIEGNCWGNNYNGVLPPWDDNMVLSFHKYWSYNDQGSIQGIINLRNTHNVPIWLGESGENSNVWFTDAIKLVESNGIGWCWWPLKKIGSVVNPMTITKTPEYQVLLDYWENGGNKPSEIFAYYTLMQMASNAKTEFCTMRPDVIDAMFRQVYDSTARSYKAMHLPGTICATDFDLGRHGTAYFDSDIANYQVSSGNYTAWNSGWQYRNDGVDIESNTDASPGANGYNVAWTKDKEWMQYTVQVDSTAVYDVTIRHSGTAGTKIMLSAGGADITQTLTLPGTSGNTSWVSTTIGDVVLYEGQQTIRLYFEKGGANIAFLACGITKQTDDIPMQAVSAVTADEPAVIRVAFNKRVGGSPPGNNDFACEVNGIAVGVDGVTVDAGNQAVLRITIAKELVSTDVITLDYSGNSVVATDSTFLQPFTDLPVRNNLPVYAAIPGKIEAEAFTVNMGLSAETCTDAGGGLDMGFTHAGDYLEYRVNVASSATYSMEVRAACLNTAGIIRVDQMTDGGQVLNSVNVNIPVTGGWQTWRTVIASMPLTKGYGRLRVTIVKPEFNMNWFRFTEGSQGLNDAAVPDLQIYPNPATGMVTFTVPGTLGREKTLSIRNLASLAVLQMTIPFDETGRVNVGTLAPGLYVVEVTFADRVIRKKLMVLNQL